MGIALEYGPLGYTQHRPFPSSISPRTPGEARPWHGSTWLEPEDQHRSRDAYAVAERAFTKATRKELVAFIRERGEIPARSRRKDPLVTQAMNLQTRHWWPYKVHES